MKRLVIGLISAFVLFVLFVVLCTFVRRPYEEILLKRFGKLIPQNQQVRIMYNWYFKLPTDDVIRVDTRLHLFPGVLQEANAGKEIISIQTFAVWHITDPELFYRTLNADDDKAMSLMNAKIGGLVSARLATASLDDLFNSDATKLKTSEIEDAVASEATNGKKAVPGTKEVPGMKDYGIQVAEVGFSRMAFAPKNAPFVYQRMVAELTKQATDFDARGVAEAQKIRAEGQRAAAEIRNRATADAQKIRGQADSEALSRTAEMQKTLADREFYQYWKSLDFLKTSLTKNTIFVLSSDSPWLRALMQPMEAFAAPTTLPAQGATPAPTLEIPSAGK